MTEPENKPASDVAVALVAQLEAGASFVDAGSFTLDAHKAREKLAAYQLAEPERYVLLLVEAAHLLPNCTGVAFTIDRSSTTVVFQGVGLQRDELDGCFAVMFIDVAGLDPEHARAVQGRQCLALALNTALGLESRIEMTSMRAGSGFVHAVFDSDGRVHTREEAGTYTTSEVVVEIRARQLADKQRELLSRDARYAMVPVHVDATRIDLGRSTDLLDPVEIRDAAGEVIGQLGWCGAQARHESGGIAFVANGVVVETEHRQELPVGALARIDAGDLQRDLSHAKLQRDKVFRQRVKAAVRSCAALSQPAPTLEPRVPPSPKARTFGYAVAWSVGIMLVLAAPLWVLEFMPVPGILALGLAIVLLVTLRTARNHRRDKVRMHGHTGLGTIKSSSLGVGIGEMRPLGIDMWIERPGQDGYEATVETVVGSKFASVQPGERMYVRIDPNDPTFVLFEADG